MAHDFMAWKDSLIQRKIIYNFPRKNMNYNNIIYLISEVHRYEIT